MDTIVPLNEEQLKQLPQEMDHYADPVRFLANGQGLNLVTGDLSSKHSNVIYHTIYWERTTEFIEMALRFLQKNNPDVTFQISTH